MIFSNNDERCTAGSRILVQKSIYADFAAKFAELIGQFLLRLATHLFDIHHSTVLATNWV